MAQSKLDLSSLKEALPTESESAVLTSHYPPSSTKLGDLEAITLKDLKHEFHHTGKIIYLRVRQMMTSTGVLLAVEDCKGAMEKLHVLCNVFQGKLTLPAKLKTIIAVKEPYYGTCALNTDAIRVDHPSDIVLVSCHDSTALELFPDATQTPILKTPGGWYDRSVLYANFGDFTEALVCCNLGLRALSDENVAEDPDDSNAKLRDNLLLGKLKHSKKVKDYTTFLQATKAFLKDHKGNYEVLLDGFTVCTQLGKFEAAKNHCDLLSAIPSPPTQQRLRITHSIKANEQRFAEMNTGAYNFRAMNEEFAPGNIRSNHATFVGPLSLKDSPLHGKGRFATKQIKSGDMVVCEKALAIVYPPEAQKQTRKLNHLGIGKELDEGQLALLQEVYDTTQQNPARAKTFFNMFSPEHRIPEIQGQLRDGKCFDSSLALSIIYNNAFPFHATYEAAEKAAADYMASKPMENAGYGIWVNLAQFNHCCLPNCSFTNSGDMVIVRAVRDIKKGEELTITYAGLTSKLAFRNKLFKKMGFTCACELCQADHQVPEKKLARRQKLELKFDANITDKDELAHTINQLVRLFDNKIYKDLPRFGLAPWYLLLGKRHMESGQNNKAGDAFLACLEAGNGLRVAKDPSSAYCELLFTSFAQVTDTAIYALWNLSDLASASPIESERRRQAALLACTKQVYKIRSGSDELFAEKWGVPEGKIGVGYGPKSKDWEKVKAEALGREPMMGKLINWEAGEEEEEEEEGEEE